MVIAAVRGVIIQTQYDLVRRLGHHMPADPLLRRLLLRESLPVVFVGLALIFALLPHFFEDQCPVSRSSLEALLLSRSRCCPSDLSNARCPTRSDAACSRCDEELFLTTSLGWRHSAATASIGTIVFLVYSRRHGRRQTRGEEERRAKSEERRAKSEERRAKRGERREEREEERMEEEIKWRGVSK